jgi:hypothetical protein
MRPLQLVVAGTVLTCGAALSPGAPAVAEVRSTAAACPVVLRDTAVPVVHEVVLGADHVDVSTGSVDVPVSVRVTDPGGDTTPSGVASVAVSLNIPNLVASRGSPLGGTARLTPAGGDWWAGVLTVSRWEEFSGVWEVRTVEAWDTAGNQVLAPGALEGRPAPTLTIAPHPLDHLQPYLADLVLAETVVDTRRHPGHLHVRVRATDAGGSGVSAVEVDGASLSRVSGTADDGWWAGAVVVPRWGSRVVGGIQARTFDAAGNVTWSYPSRLRERGLPSRFTILTTPDVTPPTARRARLSDPTVEVVPTGAQVRVDARVADALSGVRRVTAVLRGTGGAWRWSAPLTRRTGTRRDGAWRGVLALPCGFAPGSYRLELRLSDRARNGRAVRPGPTLQVR